jgi:predicted 2-oxoglutarate/Fe(II)-dependent dioxygenase YbiX
MDNNMNTTQEFKQKGYVHLKDFLHEDSCKDFTKELKRLVDQKQTTKDPQCPLSEAVHGSISFDKLLEDLTPHLELVSGLELYPTYSYARLYNTQGEILETHRDRPACEISVTLTLGFEGEVWPIYMATEATEQDGTLKIGEHNAKFYVKNISEIKMSVGDVVMYRGCDIYHWREPYKEGKWQAQVFLHYVDKNGPHAEWKYDKRDMLALHSEQELEFHVVEDALSHAFCDKLIEELSKKEVEKSEPYIGLGGAINLNIRNTKRVSISENKGLGATLTATGLNLNHAHYKFNITHANQSEFLIYEPEGRYVAHVDTFLNRSSETRKLTCLAFLNDDFEGGKFFIQTGHDKQYPIQKKGTIIVFPSFYLHGVEDVIKGIRYSAVTWLVGPSFK